MDASDERPPEERRPRLSIVIAAHNEGKLLAKTIASCRGTIRDLEYEIIVADDASTDGSVEAVRRRWPGIRVVSHRSRRGCSATKHLGARSARGDVLLFLDGHCKPERWAIVRLVNDVEDCDGQAIVTPRVAALDPEAWESSKDEVGYGFRARLEDFSCAWWPRKKMRRRLWFYESPALVGCCLAVSRGLYGKLRGFDPHMREWGVEDIDLGLKAWLMGYSILNDPHAIIGHRFRSGFDTFPVATESVLANQLRAARKSFTGPVWRDWVRRFRARQPKALWAAAWKLYREGEASADRERRYLFARRTHDEYWYARRFRLRWPVAPKPPSRTTGPGKRSRRGR